MAKPKGSNHRTEERDRKLYDAYCNKIKGLGDMARIWPKLELYEEIGDQFFISGHRASIIIKKVMKCGKMSMA